MRDITASTTTMRSRQETRLDSASSLRDAAATSERGRDMRAKVTVMLKAGVLDPQGEAVRHALGAMGFAGVNGVRQGKVIELDLAEGATEADVGEMCEKLLANTVIESYSVEMI